MLMSTTQNNRVMIVVWQWSKADKTGVNPTDWQTGVWRTSNGNFLVRLDMRESEGRADFLSDLIAKNFSDCEVTLFLHQNSPHNFEEKERIDIQNRLNKAHLKARPIFFYGGDEPIYFSHNPLGILGMDGDFPNNKWIGQNLIYSDFIEDWEGKRFNQKHFDFVWDFYWYGRRERLLELSEAFRILTFSYEIIAPEMPAKDFLARTQDWGSDVGSKLSIFAQNSGSEADVDEYNMHQYHVYLQAKANELHKESKTEEARSFENSSRLLRMVQDEMNQLLASRATGADTMTHFTQAYNNMIKSYISLPESTL